MNDFVTLVEVSPRDGLQNEKSIVETDNKVKLIDGLSQCGLTKIEVTSFVSPKWVPQLFDAQAVFKSIKRAPKITYCALTPNLRGLEAAIEAGADEVAIFASASEGFSQKNINCTIAQSIDRFKLILKTAKDIRLPVRGYVSCVTDCPYDGPTPPEAVRFVTQALLDLGCFEISLGDTIGSGTPSTVERMLNEVLISISASHLAGHFHDTHGLALANIDVCLEAGLRTFDSAVGGLGGCPYAPGAQGNVATEAVVNMLHAKGFETGVDLFALNKIAQFAKTLRV